MGVRHFTNINMEDLAACLTLTLDANQFLRDCIFYFILYNIVFIEHVTD